MRRVPGEYSGECGEDAMVGVGELDPVDVAT
jgi:hypothetical protein